MLRIPHCLDNRLIDGGKVVSPTHQPHFTPQKRSMYINTYVKHLKCKYLCMYWQTTKYCGLWQTTDTTSRQRGRLTKTRQQSSNSNKHLAMRTRRGSTSRHTDWLTVSRNVTLTLALTWENFRHANHVAPSIHKNWQSLRRQAAVARSVYFTHGIKPWWRGGELERNHARVEAG
jgi:hypothetical protein